jgi:hypothetical protein
MHLRTVIELYLRTSNTPPTRFGREACKDPRLVHDMRLGREIGPGLAAKIIRYMEEEMQ